MNEILLFNTHLLPKTELQWVLFMLDIGVVYLLMYRLLIWIRTTHSGPLLRGLFVIVVIFGISSILHLATLNWILEKIATALLLIAIIIFQPELRRFLERVGNGLLFSPLIAAPKETKSTTVIKHLLKAIETLSKDKIGALIVIEVSTNLNEYIESGIPIHSKINAELLTTLFWPKTPTHDGAVIIRENKIEAASCMLPLTDSPVTDRRLGTRHRAAIGLSQLTDALVIVVSEESGTISLAENGNLTRFLNREALETRLFNLYREDTEKPKTSSGFFKFFTQ